MEYLYLYIYNIFILLVKRFVLIFYKKDNYKKYYYGSILIIRD